MEYMSIPVPKSINICIYIYVCIYKIYLRITLTHIYICSVHETGPGIGMVQISSPSGLESWLYLLFVSGNDWIIMPCFLSMALRASSKSGASLHQQVLAYLMIMNKPLSGNFK